MDTGSLLTAVRFTVQEMYVKLGSSDGAVSLYVPLTDLPEGLSPDGFAASFAEKAEPVIGRIECVPENGRLRITVPEEACRLIEGMPVSPVLTTVVECIRENADPAELRRRLGSVSDTMVWKDVRDGDFDHVVRFDASVDPYIYCIRSECGHITYHRLSAEDYVSLGYGL